MVLLGSSLRDLLALPFACFVALCSAPISFAQEEEEAALTYVAPDAAPNVDQATTALRRYARINAAFARRVCQLTADQEQKLELMNDAWVTDTYQKQLGKPAGNPPPAIQGLFAQGQLQPLGQAVTLTVQNNIDKEIQAILTTEQNAELKKEQDERDAFRRESIAGVIVSILDRRLFLTPEQRAELQPAIAKRLRLQGDIAWQIYLSNEGYIPPITKETFKKILLPEQVKMLNSFQEVQFNTEQMDFQANGQQPEILIEK